MNARTDAKEISKSELTPRVLLCVSDNTITSGAFRSCAYLAKELRNHGLSCTVLLPRDGNGFELLDSLGVDYVVIQSKNWIVDDPLRLNSRTFKTLAALVWNHLFAYPRIANYIKQEKIDIVHQNTTWSYMGPRVAMSLGVPVVWHLREFLEEIPEGKKIVVFCEVGLRGYVASRILMQNGFEEVYNLIGGMRTYRLIGKQNVIQN